MVVSPQLLNFFTGAFESYILINKNNGEGRSLTRSKLSTKVNNAVAILVALVLDMSRTCPGLVPTVPVLVQNTVFMGTQDRLQNVSHGSVTCPSCPATRLFQSRTKNK